MQGDVIKWLNNNSKTSKIVLTKTSESRKRSYLTAGNNQMLKVLGIFLEAGGIWGHVDERKIILNKTSKLGVAEGRHNGFFFFLSSASLFILS